MGLVIGVLLLCIHHVEEVLDISEILIWWNDGFSDSVPIASSSDGWSTSHHPIDMLVPLLLILVDVGTHISWVGLWIERTQGSDASTHHTHGMSVVAEALYKLS